MPSPDRNRHSTDSDRDRVAAERTEVEWLYSHALVETEMPQAARFDSSSAPHSIERTRAFIPTSSWSRLSVSGWNGAFILATDYH